MRLYSIFIPSLVLVLVFETRFAVGFSHKSLYPKPKTVSSESLNDVGDPLILTPFIKAGKIKEGQLLSRVTNLTSVVSYSGYLTVNEKYNSNMFFWFFPAQFNSDNAPVLLWLQGGPGGSSLFGLFVENGPFIIDKHNEIQFRSTSWSLTHNVLYLDNPVGTGFSFTDHLEGYARSETDVSRDLYSALTQFFTLFPEYQQRDFYTTGESYAGKYVPAISHKIHVENLNNPEIKINLKGMAIGDGFSDPVNMMNYGEYLFNIGLLDHKQKQHFHQEEERTRNFIRTKQYKEAFQTIDELMDGDLIGHPSYFKNCTGLDFYFNFLIASNPPDMDYYNGFVQQEYVRRSLHVGNKTYNDGSLVETYLRDDMYQSVSHLIIDLLDAKENYSVLIYSGQLDIIVANILTVNFLEKLRWHGADAWKDADRKIWRVGGELAGYTKVTDNLTYLLIRNAGHMVPYDQPKWSFDMINRFTAGKPFA